MPCDLSVVIRTMFVKNSSDIRLAAGGAITVQSTPRGEWEEMLLKAGGPVAAVESYARELEAQIVGRVSPDSEHNIIPETESFAPLNDTKEQIAALAGGGSECEPTSKSDLLPITRKLQHSSQEV